MDRFKKGDLVVCVDDEHLVSIKVGEKYIIAGKTEHNGNLVNIYSGNEFLVGFYHSRFVKLSRIIYPNKKISDCEKYLL